MKEERIILKVIKEDLHSFFEGCQSAAGWDVYPISFPWLDPDGDLWLDNTQYLYKLYPLDSPYELKHGSVYPTKEEIRIYKTYLKLKNL